RGRGDIVGPVGAASEGSLLIVRGVRLVLQASVQAALRALHFRGMIAPNKSFKPNALRYTNNMADKACHVVGSATHVGLTQALCPKTCPTSLSSFLRGVSTRPSLSGSIKKERRLVLARNSSERSTWSAHRSWAILSRATLIRPT